MRKIFVLDTNVLLRDSEAIFKFQEHTVVIPLVVVEELDRFKSEKNELGRNARAFSRYMDKLRQQGYLCWDAAFEVSPLAAVMNSGPIIVNDEGGVLKVVLYQDCYSNLLSCGMDMTKPDNQILACALSIDSTDAIVVLVSKDINMRIKGDIYGLNAQDYENDKVGSSGCDGLYTGTDQIWVSPDVIADIYADGFVNVCRLGLPDGLKFPNIGLLLVNETNDKNTALCVYDDVMKTLVLLPEDQTVMGITPRNCEQKFALSLLTNPAVEFVSIAGKAGSGKTLVALAGALYGVLVTKEYDKVMLLKPIMAANNSNELGFLPGSMDEKLAPWMASFSDNLSIIMGNFSKEDLKIGAKKAGKKITKAEQKAMDEAEEKEAGRIGALDELKALGLVECGSLEHMRGRSIPRMYIIVDETQNLTPLALKTLITRAGENTKVVLLGDPSQIDSPYLDATSCGLVVVTEKFKTQGIAGHITMKKSERSRLAEIASEIL
jgi:PhoH-like ATPase